MKTSPSSIALKGGLFVQADAIALAVRLEFADHALSVKDGNLIVSHGATLSAEDRAQIKQLRGHLMAIAGYEVPA